MLKEGFNNHASKTPIAYRKRLSKTPKPALAPVVEVILVFLRRAFCNKRFFGRSFFVFCQLQQVAGRSQLPRVPTPPPATR
jgi:hypothetical protein